MSIIIHRDIVQGTDEWLAIRRGILTASEMKRVITPSLSAAKIANNEKTRALAYELASQRITGYVEPHYVSDDMLRGQDDETRARDLYHAEIAPVEEVGFITNDNYGFVMGCSPDGLVGDDGMIEIKSRVQKYQLQTIVDGDIPDEYKIQVQSGLLISGRKWCDFISYCGGFHMVIYRVYPDIVLQAAIIDAAAAFNQRIDELISQYNACINNGAIRILEAPRVERDLDIIA